MFREFKAVEHNNQGAKNLGGGIILWVKFSCRNIPIFSVFKNNPILVFDTSMESNRTVDYEIFVQFKIS